MIKNQTVWLFSIALMAFTGCVQAQEAKVGSIKIENAYVRATAPGQPAAGAFMKIENGGTAADQLVSASSPAAGEVQLHQMSMEGNVMKMGQVKDIVVPANGSVDLKPGGYHIMLMNIKAPLKAGETVHEVRYLLRDLNLGQLLHLY